MLDLEDSALGDCEAGNLPGVPDDDEIKIHLLVSAHPRGHYPPVYVSDILLFKQLIPLFPKLASRVGATSKLDDGELCAVGDLNPVCR